MKLKTNNLILRPFVMEDAPKLFKNYTSDERVTKWCSWDAHKSEEETITHLRSHINDKYRWAITLRSDETQPIGCIDVVGEIKGYPTIPEIGYALAYDYWGRGYMTEALKAVIQQLFADGYTKVGACHIKENVASGRVMQKSGMRYIYDAPYTCKGKEYVIAVYIAEKDG